MELKEREFNQIREYIKEHYGISLGDEKSTLVFSRLRPLLKQKGFGDFSEYINYLKNDKSGEAAVVFINRLTTNHTFFMREPEHIDFLRANVFPWIEDKHGKARDLRLWCAGCSSGEEAYTLQMAAQDYFDGKQGWDTEILATDISERVLQQATLGIYSNESLKTMPDDWLKKYFKRYDNDNMVARDELKKHITYRKFNLMEENLPFKKKFHVIFCRNVMIYFDNNTREALVNRYYNALENDGYLFIGHSESLSNVKSNFKYVMPAVYKK
ncbi:MAG: protein-glutamate O-methyltransferase CheR [Defluviitaleaceae bacterium]|nr:protein-glutamate O-methyltransferase CheR [Defluviitaleaceae bacterium]